MLDSMVVCADPALDTTKAAIARAIRLGMDEYQSVVVRNLVRHVDGQGLGQAEGY